MHSLDQSKAGVQKGQKQVMVLGPDVRLGSISTHNYYVDLINPTFAGKLSASNIALAGKCPVGTAYPGRGILDERVPAFSRRLDNFLLWPLRLRSERSDLFHIVDQGLAWYSRFLRSANCVCTVHDLINFQSLIGEFSLFRGDAFARWMVRQNVAALKEARHIIAISENTREKLIEVAGIKPDRVSVVYNYARPEFRVLARERRSLLKERFLRGAELMILHVGKDSVYKNRVTVIRTFAALRKRFNAILHIVPGECSPESMQVLAETGIRDHVVFHSSASTEDLVELYNCADVFLFPSHYEGFGVPIIEAMACGCPVVCSEGGSLKELSTGAAITVGDSSDVGAFECAIGKVLSDSEAGTKLVEQGLARASVFTRDASYAKVAEIYERFL